MPRSATGLAGLLARAASSPAGESALAAATLSRLSMARRRGRTLDGALEVVRRARFLADRDSCDRAHELLTAGAAQLRHDPERAVLAVEDAIISLDDAQEPRRWDTAVETLLVLADQAWEEERDDQVEELVDMALRLLFHRELHFSAAPSALTEDPVDLLGSLHASLAWSAITAPHRGEPAAPPAPTDVESQERPRRVLFISMKNWTFVRDIVEDYRADPAFEVRTADLATPGVLRATPSRRSLLAARIHAARTGAAPEVPPALAEDLAWADTIFVEWCAAAAVWTSLVRPRLAPHARLVVRLHSFEASTPWPQLVDWSTVDVLLTVSPAIRAVVNASLDLPRSLEEITVPNRAPLTDYQLPKTDGASRTLALVGWGSRRKDPAWALDVLDILRQDEPAWRLLLIGPDFPRTDALPAAEAAEGAAVRARLEALGEQVTITGQTDQVAEYLRGAGVIVSSSRREGTHEGFIQGVASGALPVCRDWPDVSAWGGPAALFPPEWVVRTPDEAAERIRALADDDGYRAEQARRVLERWDWSVVRGAYDALLRGEHVEAS